MIPPRHPGLVLYFCNKDYGVNLKALEYLRKKINPKIKFTFYKLDKIEKKILKKYKII